MSQTMLRIGDVAEGLCGVTEIATTIAILIGGMLCRDRILSNRPREGWIVGAALALIFLHKTRLFPDMLIYAFFSPRLPSDMIISENASQVLFVLEFATAIAGSFIYAIAWGLILYAAFGSAKRRVSPIICDGGTHLPQSIHVDELSEDIH